MDRILVLRGGALGDFIVTLPALAALRARWPAARIELAGNAVAARLALTRGLLDAVHSQNESRWATLYSANPLPREFAAWLGNFELVLNFWPDADGDLARHFPFRPAQIYIAAPAQPAIAPAAAHFCAALGALGIAVSADQLWFQLSNTRTERAAFAGAARKNRGRGALTPQKNLQPATSTRSERTPPTSINAPLIAIHPGSGSPAKNWPLGRWIELCAELKNSYHAEFLVITGEAESLATRSAFANWGRVAHDLPLEELVITLSSCQLFLGHDSGVSHLAAACGVPSGLLFGPTDPVMWAPPTPCVRVIERGATLSSISVPDVKAQAAQLLAARK